jgi:RimJ/RimL family protein N-acetyltransferase
VSSVETFPLLSRSLRLREGVQLVPLKVEQAGDMFRWMRDPEVYYNVGVRREPSFQATTEWIRRSSGDESTSASAVMLGERYVGNVILDRIDRFLMSARLSVYVGESTQRRLGIGTTAVYLKLAEGFDQLALHKIWLVVRCGNRGAVASYARLGFQTEGILRDEFWYNGLRESAYYMGLLRDEFARYWLATTIERQTERDDPSRLPPRWPPD